jgi:hypothetical protein
MKHLLCSDVKYFMACAVTCAETEPELNRNLCYWTPRFQVFTVVIEVVFGGVTSCIRVGGQCSSDIK